MDDAALEQLRTQMWRLSEQVSETERRASIRAAEVENRLLHKIEELDSRVRKNETWIENQRTRHASTPIWIFGIVGAIGTISSIGIGLYAAGLLW